MKIISAQISPIFQAYTKQLRIEYARADRESQIRQAPARGYETVTLSSEARALAARGLEGSTPRESEKTREEEESPPSEEAAETGETMADPLEKEAEPTDETP
jgi:hypothetical protein